MFKPPRILITSAAYPFIAGVWIGHRVFYVECKIIICSRISYGLQLLVVYLYGLTVDVCFVTGSFLQQNKWRIFWISEPVHCAEWVSSL